MKALTGLPPGYRLGIVEGFFGREWTWQQRHDWASFLASTGCNSWLYAPKGDSWLRRQWQVPFPQKHLEQLTTLASKCSAKGIDFGIGLSPYELYRDFSAARRAQLLAKLDAISSTGANTLCLLFDDMPGDFPELARAQCEIMAFVMTHSKARRFVFCPTYYSSDPLLARFFGREPSDYLDTLGLALDPQVEIFWTGPKVISTEYPADHLQEVAGRLRRRPLLWDNYPVNDAQRLCGRLHLKPPVRDLAVLQAHTSGHLANPMNQPWLSRIPVQGLALQYADRAEQDRGWQQALQAVATPALARLLTRDEPLFSQSGLDSMDDIQRQALAQEYSALAPEPMAAEICDWLQGGFAFDPACLT